MIKRLRHASAVLLMTTTAAAGGLLTAGVAHAAELHNDKVGTYWGSPSQTEFVQCQSEADSNNKRAYGTTHPSGPELYYCAHGEGTSYNLWWSHYR